MTDRLTPEQKAQQVAAGVMERIKELRLAATRDDLDQAMRSTMAWCKANRVAHPTMQHIRTVTYAETAKQLGAPSKPLSKADRDTFGMMPVDRKMAAAGDA